MTERKIFSLYELTTSLESVISKTYSRAYWIRAEVAKLNFYPKSGHCYPDLVEKENGVVRAQLRATIWAGPYREIAARFLKETHEPLADGMKVLVLATLQFHPVHGLTLQIQDIDPSFSLGELARERMESINRLKEEGLYDRNHQLELALIPHRIAVISVETSKGYLDFMKVLSDYSTHYAVFTFLFPALLQGPGAVKTIREQLKRIKSVQHHFDVVVIIRGGGGDVGLSSYDHYDLAAAVASFPLPVITGIGHSTNLTVTELVAHRNLITPTEVAYYLLQQLQIFNERLSSVIERMEDRVTDLMDFEQQVLERIARRFRYEGAALVSQAVSQLDRIVLQLNRGMRGALDHQHHQLMRHQELLQRTSSQLRKDQQQHIRMLVQQLTVSAVQQMNRSAERISLLSEKSRLLDPARILQRGYSLTFGPGGLIKDPSVLAEGDELVTRFHHHSVRSRVTGHVFPDKDAHDPQEDHSE